MSEELFKTYKDIFDRFTINALWELITQKKLEGLESPIKIGKESNVFSALTKYNERVAVKVYRLNSVDFFQMSKYLEMDPKFRPIKQRVRIVAAWAKREFFNIKKAYEAGVSVPQPIAIKNNVLIIEFIGTKFPEHPTDFPKIKDSCADPEEMYNLLIKDIKKLYQKAKLVHGDLSEFNILERGGVPVIIDLSHSIPSDAPSADELLKRDVEKIVKFFNKKGLKLNVPDVLHYIKKA
ncbi:MAG: serine protein kinase RIO [Nanoarchaeota archaeon]|nr:serine protein kinase RIO [Nanoarchaeota archaeon]